MMPADNWLDGRKRAGPISYDAARNHLASRNPAPSWHGLAVVPRSRPRNNPTGKPALGEIAVHRHLFFLCSIVIALSGAESTARAADPERCQGLARRYETAKPQISATEVSLTLFSAVDANCLDLATQLLDQAASVDAPDRFGARPLSHAAKSGHPRMVDLLLARRAPIDARNLDRATALYLSAEGSHILIAQRLIERGADVYLAGRSAISPIAAA